MLHSRALAALSDSTRAAGVSQTVRRLSEGANYIRQGGHLVGHRPTFYSCVLRCDSCLRTCDLVQMATGQLVTSQLVTHASRHKVNSSQAST